MYDSSHIFHVHERVPYGVYFANIIGRDTVLTVHLDYDIAQWQAASEVFRMARISGCKTHFDRASWAKIKSLGLSKLIATDEDALVAVQRIMALPFLPPDDILGAFEVVIRSTPVATMSKLKPWVLYVWDYWLNQVGPNLISVYDELVKTTNAIESNHARLIDWLGEHPPPWFFIRRQTLYFDRVLIDVERLAKGKNLSRCPRYSTQYKRAGIRYVWDLYDDNRITTLQALDMFRGLSGNTPALVEAVEEDANLDARLQGFIRPDRWNLIQAPSDDDVQVVPDATCSAGSSDLPGNDDISRAADDHDPNVREPEAYLPDSMYLKGPGSVPGQSSRIKPNEKNSDSDVDAAFWKTVSDDEIEGLSERDPERYREYKRSMDKYHEQWSAHINKLEAVYNVLDKYDAKRGKKVDCEQELSLLGTSAAPGLDESKATENLPNSATDTEDHGSAEGVVNEHIVWNGEYRRGMYSPRALRALEKEVLGDACDSDDAAEIVPDHNQVPIDQIEDRGMAVANSDILQKEPAPVREVSLTSTGPKIKEIHVLQNPIKVIDKRRVDNSGVSHVAPSEMSSHFVSKKVTGAAIELTVIDDYTPAAAASMEAVASSSTNVWADEVDNDNAATGNSTSDVHGTSGE
ncbi:hypothetical protein QAD02_000408 [Eretmocerus hayati]|uniref:Uncharacterized protein n=1 Tax=Eretmocerus hayati TaxID=131215 RepID=A0ACC2NDK9_9HYME|nr:hypothetical protein QAD02_000408 [Eretmocerus hayati]